MAQKGQRNLVRADAAAIVRHPDKLAPALLDLHSNRRGLGVDGIFQQLLYHRGRALNDLPGGNLVDRVLIQDGNGHPISSL